MRFAALMRPRGPVLDLACGSGRHVRSLATQGFAVTAVDRDATAVAPLREIAEIVVADIESGPWPLPGRRFDGVVITNYLWRALTPTILASLAQGGILIHETFARGQDLVGKPSRPEFLLQPGELLQLYAGLRVIAYEDGFQGGRYVQRITAVNEMPEQGGPARYDLGAM